MDSKIHSNNTTQKLDKRSVPFFTEEEKRIERTGISVSGMRPPQFRKEAILNAAAEAIRKHEEKQRAENAQS